MLLNLDYTLVSTFMKDAFWDALKSEATMDYCDL